MYITYKKGELSHLKVEIRALEKDFIVCYPKVEARFDMILVSSEGKCYRCQIKYLDQENRASQNSLYLDLRKETRNNGKKKTYSLEEIDVVLAYVPRIEKIIWVGPELFHNTQSITFRLRPPKNNQKSKIRMINDFIW